MALSRKGKITVSEVVYLNGQFMAYEDAVLPIEDRATVFADGVYEVIRFYDGHPILMKAHMDRLVRSAAGIQLPEFNVDQLTAAGLKLARKNGIDDGNLYVQVSRGVAPRTHAFPDEAKPTIFMTARNAPRPHADFRENGISCVTFSDIRWLKCDIKSIALLPNVLAKQHAKEKGAFESLFVRDGILTEASSANLFGVKEGELYTYPDGPHILSGITRRAVLTIAEEEGINVHFTPIALKDISDVDEFFICGTNTEVLAVVDIDGKRIGDGKVGPITQRIFDRYEAMTAKVKAGGTVDYDGDRFITE